MVSSQANNITFTEGRGLPARYYVSAHLLRVVKLVNKLTQRTDLQFLPYLCKVSHVHKALDHIDGVTEVTSIASCGQDGRWHRSSRSKLLDIGSNLDRPTSDLCRRLFTNRERNDRPLDAYVCYWVSSSGAAISLPWKRARQKTGALYNVLELSDDKSPLDRVIWFTVEDKRFQILLHGNKAVRNKSKKKIGANKRLEKTPTTGITANDNIRQMNQTNVVRTQMETISSVKKLMAEAAKFETEPSCPGGLEF